VGGRRENGAGSVYFDHKQGTGCRDARYHRNCTGRWSASLSAGRDGSGKRRRIRLTDKTRTGLLEKIRDTQRAAESGLDTSTSYTVSQCLDDFLAAGLEGLAPNTVSLYTHIVKLLRPQLSAYKLRELSSVQAQAALKTIARDHTARTVAMSRNVLERAIRFAQAQDKVARNVAEVVRTPAGQKASQSRRAFTVEQMFAVLDAATGWKNIDAFVHLGFLTGASPDELRGLHWAQIDDLDGDAPGIDVTRTLRHHGGIKTAARVRGLGLPEAAVLSLKRHRKAQNAERLAAGAVWEDNDLVFCTDRGRPLDRGNVGRAFKLICKRAGMGDAAKRVPYEMRHTYASIVHDSGVPAEEVAQQLGHSRTAVFEMVYRHVLKPRRREGQAVMETIIAQRTG
jgi:integrase